jgi:type I restriction enzyme S subunit
MVEAKTKVKRYDTYKNSSVEWLGEIPEHWEVLANKHIFSLKKNQVGKKSDDYDLLSLTLKGVVVRNLENGGKFPAEFDTYQEVKKGDFVFCLFDVEETPRCVGLSDFDGMITGAYTVMEPNENFDKRFLYHYYLNLDADKRMKPLYTGLRNTISKDNFFAFKTFVPPLKEQTKIAEFLDDKATKIEDAITIKKQQINLLKERKQILIHKTVTQGLNPNVTLKDSGVEWIGEIPEGWELKKVKHIAKVVLGKMLCNEDKGNYSLKPYLKSKNIQWLNVDINSVDKMWFSQKEMNEYRLEKGDLVLSEGGEVGKTCIWNNELKECYIQNSAHKVTVYKDNISEFYLNLFFVFGKAGAFDSIVNRVSIGHLTKDKLMNVVVVKPPLSEQKEISTYIKSASQKIEIAISLKQQEIEKLKEYKSSLINSVVTGKVKVC